MVLHKNHNERMESLRQQYMDLSKAFVDGIQNQVSSDALEQIKMQIREIVSEMQLLESNDAPPAE